MKKILVLGGVGAMASETTVDLVKTSDFAEIMVADIDIAKAESVTKTMGDERLRVAKINAESID
ncbi:MAG: saccharopine dehydrogenase NADP-binding domain-containing protein, partial [Desulfobacterales bacterium]